MELQLVEYLAWSVCVLLFQSRSKIIFYDYIKPIDEFSTVFGYTYSIFRRTYWLANMVKEGRKITGPEQLKDAAFGCARIRGDTLGIVGLGNSLEKSLIGLIFRVYSISYINGGGGISYRVY